MVPHRLDPQLETIIFDVLGGEYSPDPIQATQNLNSGQAEVTRYIGTYFPRSYVEQLVLWTQLLQSSSLLASWRRKKSLRVLDIGSGTGGNLHGFLRALRNSSLKRMSVELHAVDGNPLALETQQTIAESMPSIYTHWNSYIQTFSHSPYVFKNELAKLTDFIGESEFDIILCSKFISELYFATYPRNPISTTEDWKKSCGYFKNTILWSDGVLASDGIFVVVDVPVKEHLPKYIPLIYNDEFNQISQSLKLKLVLPRSCAHYQNICLSSHCYQSANLRITHRQKEDDRSNIVLKVFAKDPLAASITTDLGNPPEQVLIATTKRGELHDTYCVRGSLINEIEPNTCCEDVFGRTIPTRQ